MLIFLCLSFLGSQAFSMPVPSTCVPTKPSSAENIIGGREALSGVDVLTITFVVVGIYGIHLATDDKEENDKVAFILLMPLAAMIGSMFE